MSEISAKESAKFTPSSNSPFEAANTANFDEAAHHLEFPCALAAGAKLPSGRAAAEGFLFANQSNLNEKTVKLNSHHRRLPIHHPG